MNRFTIQFSQLRDISTRMRALSVWLGMLLVVVLASAGQALTQARWGTTASPTAAKVRKQFATSLGNILPEGVFTNAQIATGGVSLRNRKTGSIGINGVTGPVQAAFLYWAVITQGPAPLPLFIINVQRQFPTPSSPGMLVVGEVVGTGPQPCWIGDTITVFKASIPPSVATGNGLYRVNIPPAAVGDTSGADPWVGALILPLWEGASIVMVGAGSGTVAIYDESVAGDSALSGQTFAGNPGLSYTLVFPGLVAASGTLTLLDNLGADGQIGVSRTAIAGFADEATTINAIPVAGPGSLYNDSDWNGSSGLPLPQLWDDTGHDITTATPAGTTTLAVAIANLGEAAADCITPVANVVEIH